MDLDEEVRAAVAAIPAGGVATYGEIGRAVGIGPRHAGRAVSRLDVDVPWWRVIYADGRPATCHDGAARELLEHEGIPFLNGHVDFQRLRATRRH